MGLRAIGAASALLLAGIGLAASPLAVPQAHGSTQMPAKSGDPRPRVQPPIIIQDYTPNPAIWRLSDEDTTIYLFGTFHVLPPGLQWRTPQFDRIVAEAEELIVESSDDHLEGPAFEAAIADMFTNLADRQPTSAKLTPEAAAKWLRLGKMSGLPEESFDRMPPLFLMLMLGLNLSYEAGSTSESGVETLLEAEFAAAGKPIGSIEDPLPVLQAVIGIDEALLIEQLEADLAGWDGESMDALFSELEGEDGEVAADPFTAEHSWARGEVSEDEMFGDTPFERALHKVMLEDRNRDWALWLDKRLDSPGTILVAVGAGHFEGADSVQNMLAARGLSAERIN